MKPPEIWSLWFIICPPRIKSGERRSLGGGDPVRSEPRGLAGQTDAHMMHKWCGGVHVVMMMMMMLVMGNQAHTL